MRWHYRYVSQRSERADRRADATIASALKQLTAGRQQASEMPTPPFHNRPLHEVPCIASCLLCFAVAARVHTAEKNPAVAGFLNRTIESDYSSGVMFDAWAPLGPWVTS